MAIRKRRTIIEVARRGRDGQASGAPGPPGPPGSPGEDGIGDRDAFTTLFNTGFGAYALFVLTTGSNNTGIGVIALGGLTTGGHNTGIGAQALYALTTGSNNTAIGSFSDVGEDTSLSTALGFSAKAVHSNSVALGANTETTLEDQIAVGSRDIEIEGSAHNVVIHSPNGTRYRLTVENDGTLSATPA